MYIHKESECNLLEWDLVSSSRHFFLERRCCPEKWVKACLIRGHKKVTIGFPQQHKM